MTHEEKDDISVDVYLAGMKLPNKLLNGAEVKAQIKKLCDQARSEGYESCKRDNALLNEIRNEQFFLGKKQGWNEAIAEAVKVAEELKEREVEAGCDYSFPPACYDEVAESINKLKRG